MKQDAQVLELWYGKRQRNFMWNSIEVINYEQDSDVQHTKTLMQLRKEHWEGHIENILNISSLVEVIHIVTPLVLAGCE